MHSLNKVIDDILKREGGYVNHPDDKGGPTNMGVTRKTLSKWRGVVVSPSDVENLRLPEARIIYKALYWDLPGFDALNLHYVLAEMVFDTAIHSGPRRAKQLLQKAAGVKADGLIGPLSREAIQAHEPIELASAFIGERVEFLGKLITKKPSQAVFAFGWMVRMNELIRLIK